MLDHFLSAAYSHDRENMEKRATVDALKKLPNQVLAKLANGTVKLSDIENCCADGDGPKHPWLDQFKGSPLMDQAMALEEQNLALDVQDMQERQQRRMEVQSENSVWDQKDQLRLQKKLLELQLYQHMLGGSEHAAEAPMPTVDAQKKKPVPEAGAPGAGAMGPEAENSEENMAPVGTRGPGDAKTASVERLTKLASSPMGKLAAEWGRELARAEFEKKALPSMGALAGAGKSLLGGAKTMWGAMPAAQKSKMLGGAAIGALGGAASQAHDQQGWHPMKALAGAAGGAALGGAAGGVAHNIGEKGLMGGLKQTGTQASNIGSALAQKAQGFFPKG